MALVVRVSSDGYYDGLMPITTDLMKAAVVDVLQKSIFINPRSENLAARALRIFTIEPASCELLFDVISSFAGDILSGLQDQHARLIKTLDASDWNLLSSEDRSAVINDLFYFKVSLKYFAKLSKLESQIIPISLKAQYLGAASNEELISQELRQSVEYVNSACSYNVRSYKQLFKNTINPILAQLGWDLENNKEEIQIIKKLANETIVPIKYPPTYAYLMLSSFDSSIAYPWENYIIDQQITPNDFKIRNLISRLPLPDSIPENYICPITREIMFLPTRTSCGHIFDRYSIITALRANPCCPLHSDSVSIQELSEAKELREEIHNWINNQFMKITVYTEGLDDSDKLYLRGSKAGLNWGNGIPLKKIGPNHFEIEIPYVETCEYKFLINDDGRRWEKGPNHIIKEKKTLEIRPSFNSK